MHKFLYFALFLLGALIIAALTFNTNLLSNAMAQENSYEEESYNNYDDSRYNKYPTKVNKYECQIGLSKVSS